MLQNDAVVSLPIILGAQFFDCGANLDFSIFFFLSTLIVLLPCDFTVNTGHDYTLPSTTLYIAPMAPASVGVKIPP